MKSCSCVLRVEWMLPKGDVPFIPNEAPEGTEHTLLAAGYGQSPQLCDDSIETN